PVLQMGNVWRILSRRKLSEPFAERFQWNRLSKNMEFRKGKSKKMPAGLKGFQKGRFGLPKLFHGLPRRSYISVLRYTGSPQCQIFMERNFQKKKGLREKVMVRYLTRVMKQFRKSFPKKPSKKSMGKIFQ